MIAKEDQTTMNKRSWKRKGNSIQAEKKERGGIFPSSSGCCTRDRDKETGKEILFLAKKETAQMFCTLSKQRNWDEEVLVDR